LLHRRETPLDGIRREVEEEVGILAEVRLPATVVVEPAARRVDVVYAARFLGNPDAVRPDRQEAVEVCWRPAAEVLAGASESGDDALVSTATWVVLQQWALAPDGACGTARLAAALR
jgi:8-oxo-dGTP pyrophosphatase MutT (NUDIX family)